MEEAEAGGGPRSQSWHSPRQFTVRKHCRHKQQASTADRPSSSCCSCIGSSWNVQISCWSQHHGICKVGKTSGSFNNKISRNFFNKIRILILPISFTTMLHQFFFQEWATWCSGRDRRVSGPPVGVDQPPGLLLLHRVRPGRVERRRQPQRHPDRHEQHGKVEGATARILILCLRTLL